VDVSSGVSKVFGNIDTFTALKTDGSLVVWGGSAASAANVQASISSDVLYVATALTDDQLTL
jgi:hypothetical protein